MTSRIFWANNRIFPIAMRVGAGSGIARGASRHVLPTIHLALNWCLVFLSLSASAATLNVNDFGAVPDDGLDDRAAIQSAIDASASGDTVFFPVGIYDISSSIIPKSGIRLEGTNTTGSVLSFIGVSVSEMIGIGHVSNVVVSHLTLEGNLSTFVKDGILAGDGSGHRFENLIIRNFGDNTAENPRGIRFDPAVTDSVIVSNRIENIGTGTPFGVGIRLAFGSSRNLVTDNVISNTGRGGIFCNDGSTDNVILRNVVSGSGGLGLGIELHSGSDRGLVEDNHVDHWLSLDTSDLCAVRRNTVTDNSGVFKLAGLEWVESRDGVFADNLVDGGAQIGISISGAAPKEYALWIRNTVQGCGTWGAQLQGESGGVSFQYFYQNKFLRTTSAQPPALYSGQGHGFRLNENCHNVTLEANVIANNAVDGIGPISPNLDQMSFINNVIINNGNLGVYDAFGPDLEWEGNILSGNAAADGNIQLSSRGFANQKPVAAFTCPSVVQKGESVAFTNTSSDPDGSIGHVLWDFGSGLPSTDSNPSFTYTQPGTYVVTLIVWDNLGRGARAERTIVVTCLSLSPLDLPDGRGGIPYDQAISASGGAGPVVFTVGEGGLPPGLGLSASGVVSGTPTFAGSYAFQVNATDAFGCTGSRAYTISVACTGSITLSALTQIDGIVGIAYSQTITASGGTSPYGFTVTSGTLPPGLILANSGLLQGTPTTLGSFTFTVRATDKNGCTGSRTYVLNFFCPTLTLSALSQTNGTVGIAYSQTITASGGTSPYGFTVTSGTLPPGLILANSGLLQGTPTTLGSFTFTLRATDKNGCQGSRAYTIGIVCPTITVSPLTLPDGKLGVGYGLTISAVGGTPPHDFAVTAGALPPGLGLNNVQQLVGAFTESGSFSFTITATDVYGCSGNQAYIVNVPPVANFTGSPTTGLEPLEVTFEDVSTGTITNRVWGFGDGTSTNTTARTVLHTYTNGSYTVSLAVSGYGGSDSKTNVGYIVVGRLVSSAANYIATPTNGPVPLSVDFINQTVGSELTHNWDFGDGHSSTNPFPTHIYTNTGAFSVSLTVTGPGGTNTLTRTDYITATNPPPSDVTPPSLVVLSPSDDQSFVDGSITVSGTANDESGIKRVMLNSFDASLIGSNWSRVVNLSIGTNTLTVIAIDNSVTMNATTQTVHAIRTLLSVHIVSPTNGTVIADRVVDVSGVGNLILSVVVTNNRGGSVNAGVVGTNWTATSVPLRLGTNRLFAVGQDSEMNHASDVISVIRINTNYVDTTLRTTRATLVLGAGTDNDSIVLSAVYNDLGVIYSPMDTGEVVFGDNEDKTPSNAVINLKFAAPPSAINLTRLSFTPRKRTLRFSASGFTLTNLDPFMVAVSLGQSDLGPDDIAFGVTTRAAGQFTYRYGTLMPKVDQFFLGKSRLTTNSFALNGTLNIRQKPDPRGNGNTVYFGIGSHDERLASSAWSQTGANAYTYMRPVGYVGWVESMTLDFNLGTWSASGISVDLSFLLVNPTTEIHLEIGDFAARYPARLIRKGTKFKY